MNWTDPVPSILARAYRDGRRRRVQYQSARENNNHIQAKMISVATLCVCRSPSQQSRQKAAHFRYFSPQTSVACWCPLSQHGSHTCSPPMSDRSARVPSQQLCRGEKTRLHFEIITWCSYPRLKPREYDCSSVRTTKSIEVGLPSHVAPPPRRDSAQTQAGSAVRTVDPLTFPVTLTLPVLVQARCRTNGRSLSGPELYGKVLRFA